MAPTVPKLWKFFVCTPARRSRPFILCLAPIFMRLFPWTSVSSASSSLPVVASSLPCRRILGPAGQRSTASDLRVPAVARARRRRRRRVAAASSPTPRAPQTDRRG